MAIDPEIEEVLSALIDTVEERVGEIKTLMTEESSRLTTLERRIEGAGTAADPAQAQQLQAMADWLGRIEKQLQSLQTQQTQINSFLTGVLKLMLTKKLITQQEMVEVYKSTK